MTGTTHLAPDHSSEMDSVLRLAVGAVCELGLSSPHYLCTTRLDAGFTLAVIGGFQY